MSETENGTKTGGVIARLIGATEERIEILNPQGGRTGVTVILERLDGETKLQYDHTLEKNIGRRTQKETLYDDGLAFVFKKKKTGIEIQERLTDPAREATADDFGGVEPTIWFTTNPDGIVLMKSVMLEYMNRQQCAVDERKN